MIRLSFLVILSLILGGYAYSMPAGPRISVANDWPIHQIYMFQSSSPRFPLSEGADLTAPEIAAFRNVVQVSSENPSRVGTGIIVGRTCEWVLTAAHVVIHRGVLVNNAAIDFNELTARSDRIEIAQQNNELIARLGTVFSPFVPKQEMIERTSIDYALLKLQEPAFTGDECQPVDLALSGQKTDLNITTDIRPGFKLAMAGLQFDLEEFTFSFCNRFTGSLADNPALYGGLVVATHLKSTILHDCPTTSGASGSPVFMKQKDGSLAVIGITGGGHAWSPKGNWSFYLDNGVADFPVTLPQPESDSIAFNFAAPIWGRLAAWLAEIHPAENLVHTPD